LIPEEQRDITEAENTKTLFAGISPVLVWQIALRLQMRKGSLRARLI
jgi:hypothetical protein